MPATRALMLCPTLGIVGQVRTDLHRRQLRQRLKVERSLGEVSAAHPTLDAPARGRAGGRGAGLAHRRPRDEVDRGLEAERIHGDRGGGDPDRYPGGTRRDDHRLSLGRNILEQVPHDEPRLAVEADLIDVVDQDRHPLPPAQPSPHDVGVGAGPDKRANLFLEPDPRKVEQIFARTLAAQLEQDGHEPDLRQYRGKVDERRRLSRSRDADDDLDVLLARERPRKQLVVEVVAGNDVDRRVELDDFRGLLGERRSHERRGVVDDPAAHAPGRMRALDDVVPDHRHERGDGPSEAPSREPVAEASDGSLESDDRADRAQPGPQHNPNREGLQRPEEAQPASPAPGPPVRVPDSPPGAADDLHDPDPRQAASPAEPPGPRRRNELRRPPRGALDLGYLGDVPARLRLLTGYRLGAGRGSGCCRRLPARHAFAPRSRLPCGNCITQGMAGTRVEHP